MPKDVSDAQPRRVATPMAGAIRSADVANMIGQQIQNMDTNSMGGGKSHHPELESLQHSGGDDPRQRRLGGLTKVHHVARHIWRRVPGRLGGHCAAVLRSSLSSLR